MAIYWIDAGVLITAKNTLYGFDLVPKFWIWLHGELHKGTIRMPKIAFQEVTDGNDELARWCKERKGLPHFCVKSSARSVQDRFGEIVEYVYGKHKRHQAGEFLRGADGWIIAHALDTHGFVVSSENERSYRAKVKIPTISKHFGAPLKSTADMCRELKASF